MVHKDRLPLIRAVAQAALQQNKLTPYAYDDVIQWIDELEQAYFVSSYDDTAIRQASELMISRLRQSPPPDQPEVKIWPSKEAL